MRSGDGSSCTGSVQYGVEYGVFTEDMNNRLDIGETGAGTLTPWDEHTSSTRFHLNPAIAWAQANKGMKMEVKTINIYKYNKKYKI